MPEALIKNYEEMSEDEKYALVAILMALGTIPIQIKAFESLNEDTLKNIDSIAFKMCQEMLEKSFGRGLDY